MTRILLLTSALTLATPVTHVPLHVSEDIVPICAKTLYWRDRVIEMVPGVLDIPGAKDVLELAPHPSRESINAALKDNQYYRVLCAFFDRRLPKEEMTYPEMMSTSSTYGGRILMSNIEPVAWTGFYPISEEVREALRRFPKIGSLAGLPAKGRSELEIVRLLDNTHYDHIAELLGFIERSVCNADTIVRRVLATKDPFQLCQALAELYLHVHLASNDCGEVSVAKGPASERKPDIEVGWNGINVLIEVYSPIDFMGFQLVESHVSRILKYLEVRCGFEATVRLRRTDEMDFGYPHEIGDESAIRPWLSKFADQARAWLRSEQPSTALVVNGSSPSWRIDVSLNGLDDDPKRRVISTLTDGHSTDTRLFFECGTAEDTTHSQWGNKLKGKLFRRQCGNPAPDKLRILVVDFSQAFTGCPDFISWPKTAGRMDCVVRQLACELGETLPYDIVLPARLGYDCCFGPMIVLDPDRKAEAESLARAAGLDRPCLPRGANEVDWLSVTSGEGP